MAPEKPPASSSWTDLFIQIALRASSSDAAVVSPPEFPISTVVTAESVLGFTFSGELHNAVVRQLLFHNGRLPYEPVITYLSAIAGRMGGTYLDVGANLGYCSLVAASSSPAPMAVHAFEPSAANFYWLRRNIAENRLARQITPYLAALGAEDGTAELSDYGTGSSFVRGWDHGMADGHGLKEIRVRPLDALFPSGTLAAPTVVKIDVEGYELPVLRGGESTLSHPTTVCVMCEINHTLHPDGYNPDAVAALRTLESYGYRCFGISLPDVLGQELPNLQLLNPGDVDMTEDGVGEWPNLWVGFRLDGDGGAGDQLLASLAHFPRFLQFYPAPTALLIETLEGME